MRLTALIAFLPMFLPSVALAEVPQGPPNAGFAPAFAGQTRAEALPATPVTVVAFAEGLEHPWGIAALPDGSFVVTERPGRMRLVGADGRVGPTITGLPPVWDRGQGGLLDVAASPDFAQDRRLWWTFAAPVEGGAATALATGVLSADGGALGDVAVLWVQAPGLGTQQHFGSRVVVDGDHVFVTTGDRGQHGRPDLVQDTGTGLGKVIRLRRDGAVPGDNPLPGNPLWSLGHRNVQGATLGPDGRLWTVEHGPQGGDELNRPAPGANHGWPLVTYGEEYGGGPIGPGEPRGPGLEEPVYYWDPVIAPGGMAFHHGGLFAGWRGDLLIGSMNPGGLVRLRLEGDRVVGEERLLEGAARVRDVEVLGDGSVLLLIDSGRGAIWRVTPG